MSEKSAPEKEKKQQNILNYMGKRKESPTSTSLNPNNEEKNPVPVLNYHLIIFRINE